MRGLVLAWFAFLPLTASAAVDVRIEADGNVSLRADAPAAEILDRLAAQTGMKVVYEGAAPRARVLVAFEHRSQAEAVLMVLEGLGLDHVMRLDTSGTRPELLLLSSSASSSRSLPALAQAAPGLRPPPEEVEEEEEPSADEDVQPGDASDDTGVRSPRQPQPNRPAAGSQPAPQTPTSRPVFLPPSYPSSPFAPPPPAPPTIVSPPIPSPAPEVQGEPDQ